MFCYSGGMRTIHEDTVSCRFFAPLERALKNASHRRRCHEFPDDEFLESGVGRVIANVQSGRDWVQRLQMTTSRRLSVGNFFEALKSPRRLKLTEEVADDVRQQLDREKMPAREDPLGQHSELNGFDIYASDGHYEQSSTHSERIDGSKYAAGYFFSLNLRSHSVALLDIARPKHKREHDMSALTRLGSTRLRLGAPKGRKVIHVYDPAGIDYFKWYKWKAKGVYMISREKENSKATVLAEPPWNLKDARNVGILSDEYV